METKILLTPFDAKGDGLQDCLYLLTERLVNRVRLANTGNNVYRERNLLIFSWNGVRMVPARDYKRDKLRKKERKKERSFIFSTQRKHTLE